MLPNDTGRSRRGRVVLVGAGEQLDLLFDGLAPRAVRVDNLFEALGEIAAANAAEPVEMVVVARDLVAGAAERAVHSLRQVDRAVQIALLLDETPATMLEESAFDTCLHPRVRAAEVEALLNGAPMAAAVHASDEPVDPADPPSKAEDAQHDADGQTAEPAGGIGVSERQRDTDRERFVSLGDTDLVEALLETKESSDRFIDTALALVREQTGWTDLRIEMNEKDRASDGAPIAFGGRAYGTLIANRASADERSAWAAWLARWLALNETMLDLRRKAAQDELTGAWNRRYFNAFLSEAIARGTARRRPVTVMVFDLDDFKKFNDAFGHAAGDEILRESVRLLNSCIRKGDRVCRIGGDEFAVIFADLEGPRETGSAHPETVEQIAQRFQNEICRMKFPKLGIEAPGDLSISAGLATFPWDGRDPESLLEHADQLALQSKRRGKNAITMGPGAQHVCEEGDARQ